ncbi:MAG: CDP-diacylglycerol--glycerol-3-phosphate 3-phosphatidyltransferase [Pseudomonadota bacterium]|nr:CDP-diacylglycerol--glycerol-3-phosphate 3-phosphatidyltransferase [Pseudomonadota bacterium]
MANYITVSRVLLLFPIILFISGDDNFSNWIALGLFLLAGLTDHIDGYVARKTNTTSDLGALLDLIADKLLICITLLYLLSYSNNIDLIVPSLIIVARELIVSSIRQFLAESPARNQIKVSYIAKSKTTLQIISLSFLIISPNYDGFFYFVTTILFWLTSLISIYSLYDYLKIYKNFMK